MIREAISTLVLRQHLSSDEASGVMREIMTGQATESQISAFATAMRMKGETIDEIVSLARVMKEFCEKIHPRVNGTLVDTCGTGGDKLKTFNVSTAAAFVIAGSGVPVAKHGNRSFTSKSGSADVAESLGLRLDVDPKLVEKSIEEIGLGLIFAPRFHPAMRYAANTRKEIGIRTIFNLLGPLTNPADVSANVTGIYDESMVELIANVLSKLGRNEAMVVHGLDGIDEISTIGETKIAWLKDGKLDVARYTPKDFGVKKTTLAEIAGSTPDKNAEDIFKILNNNKLGNDPRTELVLVNAAAGIIVGGKATDFDEGIEEARRSIASGAAYRKLRDLAKAYGGDLSKLEKLESKFS